LHIDFSDILEAVGDDLVIIEGLGIVVTRYFVVGTAFNIVVQGCRQSGFGSTAKIFEVKTFIYAR
jgi:hypothetical protein